ncbi:hypothetical protein [Streptomyces macrosporus]|uniref:Uncharacterized protein n=1 Tax=Streptomyces macrosporus TaxID=44032 RepID=A0ABP5X760_9ACTN
MDSRWNRLLPVALAAAQVAWWPFGALRPGTGPVGPVEMGTGLPAGAAPEEAANR